MNVKWRLHLYSYKEKYDCAFHTVDVIAENENLNIIHVETIQSLRETAEGKAVKLFSGRYGVNTFLLSCENGEVFKQNQLETETYPVVLKLADKSFPDNKHYFFDKYDVFMESDWTMCCQERNSQNIIWKKNVRHYLYTEIECRNGILYFGTQGNGGLFYALSLIDGNTVFALQNSNFHSEYYWVDQTLLIADHKGIWSLVNPITGEIITRTVSGSIKFRSGNDFVLLCEKYNRSARLYNAEILCVEL